MVRTADSHYICALEPAVGSFFSEERVKTKAAPNIKEGNFSGVISGQHHYKDLSEPTTCQSFLVGKSASYKYPMKVLILLCI